MIPFGGSDLLLPPFLEGCGQAEDPSSIVRHRHAGHPTTGVALGMQYKEQMGLETSLFQ